MCFLWMNMRNEFNHQIFENLRQDDSRDRGKKSLFIDVLREMMQDRAEVVHNWVDEYASTRRHTISKRRGEDKSKTKSEEDRHFRHWDELLFYRLCYSTSLVLLWLKVWLTIHTSNMWVSCIRLMKITHGTAEYRDKKMTPGSSMKISLTSPW